MSTPSKGNQSRSRLARIEKFTHLLDNAVTIPGTRFTVGLDPILGLIPGAGDVVSLGISLYLIYEARQLGIPRSTQARMVANVGIDAAVGTIPILGQLADFGIKANTRNLRLLQKQLDQAEAMPEDAAR